MDNAYTLRDSMKKILIVEDEELLRKAFEFLLTAEGFKVVTANDGKQGLTALKKSKPDIVLLDMLMPVMNGMDFLESSNIVELLPGSKIIILSNLSDSVRLRDVKKYNVNKVLLKANLSPSELVAEVKKLI